MSSLNLETPRRPTDAIAAPESKPTTILDDKVKFASEKLLADQGNAEAQAQVGYYYEEGIGVEKDSKQAVMYYERAAAQKDANGQAYLGRCYLYGLGADKDIKKGLELVNLSVQQGNRIGQNILGFCYYIGEGVSKNIKLALHYYQLSADQGYKKAQCNLGLLHYYGQAGKKDIKKAVDLFRSSADQGWAIAQCHLAYCYAHGEGVPEDEKEAVRLYRLAAEQRNAEAQFYLGSCYKLGKGVEQDIKEAARLYRLAADQGHANAQYNLGFCYDFGKGVPEDKKEAVRLYRLAADQEDSQAQYNLASCYEQGEGINKDLQQAVYWYQQAAKKGHAAGQRKFGYYLLHKPNSTHEEQGHGIQLLQSSAKQGDATAQYELALCYEYGNFISRNWQEAARLYDLASQQGHAGAYHRLGTCYEDGLGVQQDQQKARSLYRKAIELGNVNSMVALGFQYEFFDKNLPEAVALYKKAAEAGDISSQYKLADWYMSGNIVKKDVTEAIRLYRLAADQGHPDALDFCFRMDTGMDKDMKEEIPSLLPPLEKQTKNSSVSKTKFGIPFEDLRVINLSSPPPTKIWVQNTLGIQEQVNISDLKKIIGHDWEDVIYYHKSLPDELKEADIRTTQKPFSQFKNSEAHDYVFISKMGEGDIGYGVFARVTLPKVAFVYNGLLTGLPSKNVDKNLTSLIPDALPGYGKGLSNSHDTGGVALLSPSGVNIASLMQHAPSIDPGDQDRKSFAKLWGLEVDSKSIATANFSTQTLRVEEIPVPLEVVIADGDVIAAKDGFFIDYGWSYWLKNNQKPLLFYRDGSIVSPTLYKCPLILCLRVSDIDKDSTDNVELYGPFSISQFERILQTLEAGSNFTLDDDMAFEPYIMSGLQIVWNQVTLKPDILPDLQKAYQKSIEGNHIRVDLRDCYATSLTFRQGTQTASAEPLSSSEVGDSKYFFLGGDSEITKIDKPDKKVFTPMQGHLPSFFPPAPPSPPPTMTSASAAARKRKKSKDMQSSPETTLSRVQPALPWHP